MRAKKFVIDNSPSPAEIQRPSILHEFKSIFQPLRLLQQFPSLAKAKKGNGHRIILFPGWKSHETVMFPIKMYLKKLGYRPEYWGLGLNNGYVEKYRDRMIEKLRGEESDEKITLIGWSLGGLIAREIAREMPDRISGVITYGTPVVGGPKYTIGADIYGTQESSRIENLIEELDATNPIQVPISIIFTKNDSIVNWSACLDNRSKNVTHYEVKSTHLSLGIDPTVWRIIAKDLQEFQ